ncbi:nucleotidyl transferase AbiEii/AbiGii toxin family protein [Motilibacter deserti]|uniref:Nucleotidyl transferase AbiEii/AbiGii toxin family protein n=1 Tax=Motilibacter deserti TaxID=2714956 RepID=A0ABX0GSD1_9ACTN|nr:nucleotidyl transferase AbiEii/AbiGii toxin family protein [Motilibacter deserti]NHC12675.1 nucleotidyl transferase AbiEii/AbiGii toxin family protein [Motilibacter deserti]
MSAPATAGQRPRWREEDPETFRATLAAAAEQLGIQPLAVQKDYWVCEALRAIEADKPDAVIFKGGTSLEKLRIIQRFSEDLDLLVVGSFGREAATKTAMRQMIGAAHAAVGGAPPSGLKSGGTLGNLHRHAYLHPPLDAPSEAATGIADPGAVLLELGQSGGRHPSSRQPVTSLLTRQLQEAGGFDVDAYADLVPFTVQVLHPGRTLLEKLLRVNNFIVHTDDPRHGWPRIGRQFYDIWALLAQQDVLAFLADRQATAEVLDDIYRVSADFGGDEPVPAGGFAASPAFDPAGRFADRLRAEHDAAMRDLYYGSEPRVPYYEVLARVAQHADLLDVRPA